MSVTNAVSMIRSAVAERFSICETRIDLIVIWPELRWAGGTVEHGSISRVPSDPDQPWSRVSRRQIEAKLGLLPPLPEHQELFRRVLELGGRVRETTKA